MNDLRTDETSQSPRADQPDAAKPRPEDNPAIDDAGVVVADLPCLECAYNLRSRSRGDACPECGEAIDRTLHDGLFVMSWDELRWLRCLWKGAATFAAACGIYLLLWLIMLTPLAGTSTFFYSLYQSMLLLTALGIFLMTRPELRTPPASRDRLRLAARWLCIGGIIQPVLNGLAWSNLQIAISFTAQLALIAGLLAAGLYTRSQMRRTGRTPSLLFSCLPAALMGPSVIFLVLIYTYSPPGWPGGGRGNWFKWVNWGHMASFVGYLISATTVFGIFAFRIQKLCPAYDALVDRSADLRPGITHFGSETDLPMADAEMFGPPLIHSSRKWLERMAAGSTFAALAALLASAFLIREFVSGVAADQPPLAVLGSGLFLAGGIFVMTKPQPSGESRQSRRSRRLARWTFVAAGLFIAAIIVISRAAGPNAHLHFRNAILVMLDSAGLAAGLGFFALGWYVHGLLKRAGWHVHWLLTALPGALLALAMFVAPPGILFDLVVLLAAVIAASCLVLLTVRLNQIIRLMPEPAENDPTADA